MMGRRQLGRVRTSTWAVMAVFVAALVTYLLVQPTTKPAVGTPVGTTPLVPTGGVPSITQRATPTRPSSTPTATPTSTPTTPSTTATSTTSTTSTTGSSTSGPSTTGTSNPPATSP